MPHNSWLISRCITRFDESQRCLRQAHVSVVKPFRIRLNVSRRQITFAEIALPLVVGIPKRGDSLSPLHQGTASGYNSVRTLSEVNLEGSTALDPAVHSYDDNQGGQRVAAGNIVVDTGPVVDHTVDDIVQEAVVRSVDPIGPG